MVCRSRCIGRVSCFPEEMTWRNRSSPRHSPSQVNGEQVSPVQGSMAFRSRCSPRPVPPLKAHPPWRTGPWCTGPCVILVLANHRMRSLTETRHRLWRTGPRRIGLGVQVHGVPGVWVPFRCSTHPRRCDLYNIISHGLPGSILDKADCHRLGIQSSEAHPSRWIGHWDTGPWCRRRTGYPLM